MMLLVEPVASGCESGLAGPGPRVPPTPLPHPGPPDIPGVLRGVQPLGTAPLAPAPWGFPFICGEKGCGGGAGGWGWQACVSSGRRGCQSTAAARTDRRTDRRLCPAHASPGTEPGSRGRDRGCGQVSAGAGLCRGPGWDRCWSTHRLFNVLAGCSGCFLSRFCECIYFQSSVRGCEEALLAGQEGCETNINLSTERKCRNHLENNLLIQVNYISTWLHFFHIRF